MLDKKILVLGAQGQLGQEFKNYFEKNNYNFLAPLESDANICDRDSLMKLFWEFKPDIVINCAAYNQVELAEDNSDIAYQVNSEAVKDIAELCRENGSFLVHYSSDYVFDGQKGQPYIETDGVEPLNVYGHSKLKGEENVKKTLDSFLIFRLSWVIGSGKQNFIFKLQEWANCQDELRVVDDEISVPTFTNSVVELTIEALRIELNGLYHLCSSGYCSRYDLAKKFFDLKNLDINLLPAKLNDFESKARRPIFSAMSNKLLQEKLAKEIDSWDVLLEKYLKGG